MNTSLLPVSTLSKRLRRSPSARPSPTASPGARCGTATVQIGGENDRGGHPDTNHRRSGGRRQCPAAAPAARREQHGHRSRRQRHSRHRHGAHRLRRNLLDPVDGRQLQQLFHVFRGHAAPRATVPLNQQVANPAANFAADNNGVIVQLPPVSEYRTVFGHRHAGVRHRHAVEQCAGGLADLFATDGTGNLNGSYKNASVTTFFDSGSNGTFFSDSSIPVCKSSSAFYCPTSELALSNAIRSTDGVSASTVNFNVVSASSLTASGGKFAFNSLAGNFGDSRFFDFGLPFFFGRHVYVGFDLPGKSTPYVAF